MHRAFLESIAKSIYKVRRMLAGEGLTVKLAEIKLHSETALPKTSTSTLLNNSTGRKLHSMPL